MKISQAGINAIKTREGLRLWAYLDDASVPTIGYGRAHGVRLGEHIDEATAEAYLRADLLWVETALNNAVRVPLTQNQYDALCSWTFNVGEGALKTSTMLEKLNAGDYVGAADELLRWDKVTINGQKVKNEGLENRRRAERAQFLATSPPAAPEIAATATPGPSPAPPRPDIEPYVQPETKMPLPAIAAVLLPEVIKLIPRLATLFPGGAVAERNVAAGTMVLDVITKATGAVNTQAAVESMQKNPEVLKTATMAVAENWFELHKAAEESTAAARVFSIEYAQSHDVRTIGKTGLTFLEVLSLILVISTLTGGMSVLLWGGIDNQLKGAVVTLMLIGGFTGVTNFWFGSSLGSKKKDDRM